MNKGENEKISCNDSDRGPGDARGPEQEFVRIRRRRFVHGQDDEGRRRRGP